MLLGPLGCVSTEAAQGLDRCYWYKADTYYADDRQFKEGDDPVAFHSLPPGGTVFQLAPLAAPGTSWSMSAAPCCIRMEPISGSMRKQEYCERRCCSTAG